MNEERIEQLAKQLGARAAERLDVNATARQVAARLHEQPVQRTVWVQQTWLRIAAALVIVLGGALAVRQIVPVRTPSGHPAHLIADDLNDLSNDQLRDVLTSFDEILNTDSVTVPDTTDWRELDSQQLREVLRALEGEG